MIEPMFYAPVSIETVTYQLPLNAQASTSGPRGGEILAGEAVDQLEAAGKQLEASRQLGQAALRRH